MQMPKIHRVTASLTLAAGLGLSGAAQAELTQYTYQVNASGQLNGQSFSNASVTVTLTGESSLSYQQCDFCYLVLADTTLIEVAGVGSDSFVQPITAVSNFVDGYVGFGEPISDYGIYFLESPAILGYMLQAPLGPVTGVVDGNPGVAFETLGGSFTFDSFDSVGTFQAVAVQVPEPGTWAMWLAGLVAVGRIARRQGIDIDAYGHGLASHFGRVRLTDDPLEGSVGHHTAGADIDAVGAISSVAEVPEPSARALWLAGGSLAAGPARRRHG